VGIIDPEALRSQCMDLEIEVESAEDGELRIEVDSSHALKLLRRLREDEMMRLVRLVDLTAIDRGAEPRRFEVIYRLDTLDRGNPVRVHAGIDGSPAAGEDEQPILDSVVTIWPVAGWLEREVFDLFGIRFRGHPELRRLLLDEHFDGAPLRKDFPRKGRISEGGA
jgi:NADH-quinone oxidoreductase subunit C